MERDRNGKRFNRVIFTIFARSGSASVNSRIGILNSYCCILDSVVSGWVFTGKTGKTEFF